VLILAGVVVSALGASTGIQELAPGIHLVPGTFSPGSQPDGNSIILDAPDGLVVMDTGRHATHVQRIIDYARGVKRPVVAIVNSHWHLDHVGGNAALRRAFPKVRVYASDAIKEARTGFLASYRKQLDDAVKNTPDPEKRDAFAAEMRLIDQGATLEPDEVLRQPGTRTIGGRALEIGLESRAVTAGDVWLFDPRSRVLLAGDLVTLPAPLLDTACPARWKASLDRLANVNFRLLVPGHGTPMSRADFDAYRAAFSNLVACGGTSNSKELCISGWLEDARTLIPEKDQAFTRSLIDYYVGVLRGDPTQAARRCGERP